MLKSELNTERPSLGFVRDTLTNIPSLGQLEKDRADRDDQNKHVRELLSENPIVTGWIRNQDDSTIERLRQRVDRFETNKHLRDTQNNLAILSTVHDLLHREAS